MPRGLHGSRSGSASTPSTLRWTVPKATNTSLSDWKSCVKTQLRILVKTLKTPIDSVLVKACVAKSNMLRRRVKPLGGRSWLQKVPWSQVLNGSQKASQKKLKRRLLRRRSNLSESQRQAWTYRWTVARVRGKTLNLWNKRCSKRQSKIRRRRARGRLKRRSQSRSRNKIRRLKWLRSLTRTRQRKNR